MLWALIPVTFIDCGFRIVGAGSITRPLAEKHGIASERLAFMLNNTASPIVELIAIATTFVGFDLAIITIGLKSAGISDQTTAYSIWLKAIPLEFFSIAVIALTFLSMFRTSRKGKRGPAAPTAHTPPAEAGMTMDAPAPVIAPRLANLVIPMLTVSALSIFFWFLGPQQSNTEPNRALLVALFISVFVTAIVYAAAGIAAVLYIVAGLGGFF